MAFTLPVDNRVRLKELKKRDKYPDLAKELKKILLNQKFTIIPNVIGSKGTVTKGLEHTERFGNNRTSGDCPKYSIVEISQNTENSPGDLKKLVVTQIPVMQKTL